MALDPNMLTSGTLSPEDEERAIKEVPVDEDLAEYVYLIGVELLEDGGGMAVLQKAMTQSQDPVVVIAQFVVQLVGQLSETMAQETNFDPRVMLVRGGFVDSISDYIVKKLGLPKEASDQIEQEVLDMIKALAQGETKPSQDGAAGIEAVAAQEQGMAPQQGAGIEAMAAGGM